MNPAISRRFPLWNPGDQCFDLLVSHGRIAKISAVDFGVAHGLIWTVDGSGYVNTLKSGKRVFLHQEIMGTRGMGRAVHVDHINGDLMDNRRSNLRIVTPQQNRVNSHSARGISGYIGVSWHQKSRKWQVAFKVRGKAVYVGLFICPIEAAIARDVAALELHGEFASLNFPELREVFAAGKGAGE